jgi:glycosyltransferase involved in cell wall biosynthesis
MAEILIVSGFEITANPRVVKEADALTEAGHHVTVLGAIHGARARERIHLLLAGRTWTHVPVLDRMDGRVSARAAQFIARGRHRLSRELKQHFGWERPMQISPVTAALTREAMQRTADLTILHLEPALWTGVQLLDVGRRVAIDFEDWYSEDLLPSDRAHRPIALITACERRLLNEAVYATTTSHALANALAQTYDCPLPSVVYNSFLTTEYDAIDGLSLDRPDFDMPSVTWFSQTVGPGRGLEDLVVAMGLGKKPYQLHIRGTPRPGFDAVLREMAPEAARPRIQFHLQVPQRELLSRLAEHDVGFCGELDAPKSRNMTITNKMFEYMRAGLAIIATDTIGQCEVAKTVPESVCIVPQGDPQALADQLDWLLSDPKKLVSAKAASAQALKQKFNWCDSKQQLQKLVSDALTPQSLDA